jgi:hypothetical protein
MAEQWSEPGKIIKATICDILAAADPDALIANRFLWDQDDEAWAGMLKRSGDDPIRAITVSYGGLGFPYPQLSPVIGSAQPELPFDIWFYHGYDEGNEEENSEEELQARLFKCGWAIGAKTDLGIRQHVTAHYGLRVQSIDQKLMGKEPVTIAVANLTVLMKMKLIRNQ